MVEATDLMSLFSYKKMCSIIAYIRPLPSVLAHPNENKTICCILYSFFFKSHNFSLERAKISTILSFHFVLQAHH